MRIGELDRIPDPDLTEFEAYVRRGMPVIIDGVAKSWAARNWTIKYLETTCGDNQIYYEQFTTDRSRLGWWDFQQATFNDYLERMRRGDDVYVTNVNVGDHFPQLLQDLDMPLFIAANRRLDLHKYRMFVGKAQRSEIHYHPGLQVILVHLAGGKRKIVLYPPSETSKLYPFRWYEQVQMSRVLPSTEEQFPEFKKARYYEYELEPGEALFIPIHWWHWVQSFDETIAVALVMRRTFRDKFDVRLELRDRASENGERILKLSPRLARFWRRFAERSAFGT